MVKEPKSDTLTRLGGFYSRDHLTLQLRMQKLGLRAQAALGSLFQAPQKGPLDPGPRSDPELSGSNLNRQGSV